MDTPDLKATERKYREEHDRHKHRAYMLRNAAEYQDWRAERDHNPTRSESASDNRDEATCEETSAARCARDADRPGDASAAAWRASADADTDGPNPGTHRMAAQAHQYAYEAHRDAAAGCDMAGWEWRWRLQTAKRHRDAADGHLELARLAEAQT